MGGRVGGAAGFETGIESVVAITDPATGQFVYPAAVVIPLEDEADSNDLLGGKLQIVTETLGVIVEFNASADRRGQFDVSLVAAMKHALFRALFYVGGELLTCDRTCLFRTYRMSFEWMSCEWMTWSLANCAPPSIFLWVSSRATHMPPGRSSPSTTPASP